MIMTLDIKTGKDIAEQLNVEYLGIQKGAYEEPDSFLFADPTTTGTFQAATLQGAKQRLNEHRKAFGKSPSNPPPIKARARIFWTRERTDERIKILQKLGLEQEPYWAQPWDKLPSHYKEAIAIHYSPTRPPPQARGGNPGNPDPQQIYDAAIETAREATRKFRAIQDDYRAKRIGDDEFLKGKADHDRAQAEFDTAETAFINAEKGNPMITDVDTALKDIADRYVQKRREMTEPELEAILLKHCGSEAEMKKFVSFLETEPGQLRFKTLLRERYGANVG